MSVLDPEKTINYIKKELSNYAKTNYRKAFIIENDDSPGFLLIEHLCNVPGIKLQTFNYLQSPKNSILSIADELDGLIIGNLNLNEINLIRKYFKYGDGLADIFPIADLYWSEIIELLNYLKIEHDFPDDCAIDEVLTYRDVEWANKENNISHIITNEELPSTSRVWFRYTLKQKEIISRLHQIEKRTRHKIIHAPIIKVRNIEGLVR